MRYNNYHKHDMYGNIRSLDCVVKPIEYIERAKELDGNKAIFFSTNHGYQGNIHEYYTLCKENGVKLIAGVETYYVPNRFEKDRSNYHLIIIAKNQEGYKAINRIMSEANLNGYYYKPRIDDELLFSLNPDDVIITTACIASRLRDIDGSEEWIIKMKEHFKDSFYLEVQNHNERNQIEYNKRILKYAEKFNIEIIHANDSHYIRPKDAKYRDLFLKAKGINYADESNFILDYPSYDEIVDRYIRQGVLNEEQINKSLSNTLIFDAFEGLVIDDDIKMPHVSSNPKEELGDIIKKEFKKELKNIDKNRKKEYIQEIEKEWEVIDKTNMYEYFLLNYKMVNLAVNKYNGVITKSSRGSCPSFYINKLLHFTSLDRLTSPVTLYPSRFMSTTRILKTRSLPDIDTNVADQQPFIDASKELLGEDSCHWILSFKPLQDSSAFRLWCKANGMNIKDYDEVAKNLDNYREDDEWKNIIKESNHFKGVVESVAQSPCSTLLLTEPISKEVGLLKVGEVICCNIDGLNTDRFKYLKNDILSVLIYKIIDETCNLIGMPIPTTTELAELLDDKTFDIYKNGLTCTINQADSKFATDLIMKYKPKNIAEMSAFVAAIRPGFASLLNNFIERKPYTTGVKELDTLLKDSYHYLMYQESIMKYLVWLNIPESETYDIIKKIAKKKFKEKELKELKLKLHESWKEVVGREEGFEETWQVVDDASRYSFNASHSLSYAYDSLYGAYLKSHYPLEYYTVSLNNYDGDSERTTRLTEELKYFNIEIKQPKFRYSKAEYMMDKSTNSIYKGIASIKYLNKECSEYMYTLKDNSYESFIDLLIDLQGHINTRQMNILITIDFFSEFGNSNKLLNTYEMFNNLYQKKQVNKNKYPYLNNIFEKFAEKETASMYKIDPKSLDILKYIESQEENTDLPVTDRIKCWLENVGSCSIKDKDRMGEFIVLDIDLKYQPRITLYSLGTSVIQDIKIPKKIYTNNKLEQYDIIKLIEYDWKFKRKKVNDEWIQTDEKYLSVSEYYKLECD